MSRLLNRSSTIAPPRTSVSTATATSAALGRTTLVANHLSTTSPVMSDQKKMTDGSTKWVTSSDGHFRRQQSVFRDTIEKGGKFEPEKGRYHLIVAHICPWAHRASIVRQLKGLDKDPELLPMHVVNSFLGSEGWSFVPYDDPPGVGVDGTGNHVPGHESKKRIREFYLSADPEYTARCTVPIIWDNRLNTIVNNESSDIIRVLNTAFDDFIDPSLRGLTFYPQELRGEIDGINEWVYDTVNNGVYKSGFATTQEAYEQNVRPLFTSLDRIEKILGDGREFLVGGRLTEADIRLYTTIIRFDPVYVSHFKCNIAMIRYGYPHIHRWLRNLYWKNPAFHDTTFFDHIKTHYFQSHSQINPTRIVPVGPLPDIMPLDA